MIPLALQQEASFSFFLEVLAGGTGEEAGGLVGLLDFTGTGAGSAGVGSGSNDFSWLGIFLLKGK